jgi:DNA-binding transcriptional MerR regulator
MYTRDELLELAAVSARTLGTYTRLGFLPRPALAGPNTRYSEEHLVRLLAVTKLRDTENLPLAAIGARLAAMTYDEMDHYVSDGGPAPDDTDGTAGADGPAAATGPALAGTGATPEVGAGARRCTRHTLAAGVELLVDADAPPASRALVETLLAAAARR